jgi:hypothetical protein
LTVIGSIEDNTVALNDVVKIVAVAPGLTETRTLRARGLNEQKEKHQEVVPVNGLVGTAQQSNGDDQMRLAEN